MMMRCGRDLTASTLNAEMISSFGVYVDNNGVTMIGGLFRLTAGFSGQVLSWLVMENLTRTFVSWLAALMQISAGLRRS
jgi:hypothetical protein